MILSIHVEVKRPSSEGFVKKEKNIKLKINVPSKELNETASNLLDLEQFINLYSNVRMHLFLD